jgi:hypothetical protein
MSVVCLILELRTDKEIIQMAKAKSKLTLEQQHRYNELMRIAEHGDYMSLLEFDELTRLMRTRGYH